MISISLSIFLGVLPLYPFRRGYIFRFSSILLASLSFKGGNPSDLSLNSSAAVPPIPIIIHVPNTGSFLIPRISSTESLALNIGCTVTPSTLASGIFCFMLSVIFLKVIQTVFSSFMLRTTPPTSDLWVISGDNILSTTGYPILLAMSAACSAEYAG